MVLFPVARPKIKTWLEYQPYYLDTFSWSQMWTSLVFRSSQYPFVYCIVQNRSKIYLKGCLPKSGIRMVIFRTLFKSSFWMEKTAILFFTIWKPDFLSGFRFWKPDRTFLTASLDRFINESHNKFMPKRSRLGNRTQMSRFRMVRYSNARDWHMIQSEYRTRFSIRWVTVISIC